MGEIQPKFHLKNGVKFNKKWAEIPSKIPQKFTKNISNTPPESLLDWKKIISLHSAVEVQLC